MNGSDETRRWCATGAIAAAAGVVAGAFGAHGLETRVSAELLEVFETGARYHLVHALALVAVGLTPERYRNGWTRSAGWAFLVGIVVFSGSLYVLTLTGVRAWGAVTPVGGVCLIAGWGALAVGYLRG